MRFNNEILIYLAVFLLFNCSQTETDPFVDSMLAKGVDAKLVSAYPDSDSQLFSFEEVLSIGGDIPDPKLFQPGEKCLVDDDGNIYFNDESRIKKFSPDGEFLGFISNQGQGPGENDYPTLEIIVDNEIVLGEFRSSGKRKYEKFGTDGEYLERIYHPDINEEIFPDARNSVVSYLGDDKFLFSASQRETGENGIIYTELKYGLSDNKGSILKKLDIVIEPFINWIEMENAGMFRPLTFTNCPIYLQDNLFLLSRNGKDIYKFDARGNLLKFIRLGTTVPESSEEEKEEIYARFSQGATQSMLNMIGIPDTKPAVCDIIVDDDGQIWLRRGDTFRNLGSTIRDEKFTYIILDEDGEYLGDQVLPVKLSTVKGGFAYGFLKTDDGFIVFKKYRLQMN